MTGVRGGFDLAVDFFAATMWAMAAFFAGARLFSGTVGLLLALAVFITAVSYIMGSRVQEQRARHLAVGDCPRCKVSLTMEHTHRRWDSGNSQWLPPLISWRCAACGFQQEERLACEACPRAM